MVPTAKLPDGGERPIDALPYCYQVTKYDPADRDDHGHYVGTQDVNSDRGPVEAAYVDAVAAFAADSGVTRLAIREPAVFGGDLSGGEPLADDHVLSRLFSPDLTGYHDGALVSVPVALELLRAMLRGDGAWCRLEDENRFLLHVGWDQYVYLSSHLPCERAVRSTHERGLYAERLDHSPYLAELDDDADLRRRPTDAGFWSELTALAWGRGVLLVQEDYAYNASRWHRLDAGSVDAVRARLTPRARLVVWPDLSADVGAVLAEVPGAGVHTIVWDDGAGRIRSRNIDEDDHPGLPVLLADAVAATLISNYVDERHPLLSGVLPDPDGVLRARWAP